jgi:probable phosphoglycerate mutase
MARLVLVRHAPTPETGTRLTGRLPGVSLDERGRRIAERTADHLAGVRLAAVYASPIERTWETAVIVASRHGLEPVRHDGLLEVDYGRWSGRTLKSLARLKAWQTVQRTPSRMVFPEGEALAAAAARAVETCESLAAGHRTKTIALVSHADIIKAVLGHYLGQPLDLFQRIAVSPGSVSVVDLPPGGMPIVAAVNTLPGGGVA